MDLREARYENGQQMELAQDLCPVAVFGISEVEPVGSAAT